LTWGSEKCPTTLSKDGTFWCLFRGEPWTGTWHLHQRTLHVSEARVPQPGEDPPPGITWEVDLDKDLRGEVKTLAVHFALTRD
jgi:hypothetical protein